MQQPVATFDTPLLCLTDLQDFVNNYFQPNYLATLTPEPTIQPTSVTNWDYWRLGISSGSRRSVRGLLRGYKYSAGKYAGCLTDIPEIIDMTRCVYSTTVEIPIRDISGVFGVPSSASAFSSLGSMAKAFEKMFEPEDLKCAADRVAESKHTFVQYSWDGRIFLGDTHELELLCAAMLYDDGSTRLQGGIARHELNRSAIESLNMQYAVFAIPGEFGLLRAFYKAIRQAMATHYILDIPPPYNDYKAIFFPRNDPQANWAINEFKKAGLLDVCAHLLAVS